MIFFAVLCEIPLLYNAQLTKQCTIRILIIGLKFNNNYNDYYYFVCDAMMMIVAVFSDDVMNVRIEQNLTHVEKEREGSIATC